MLESLEKGVRDVNIAHYKLNVQNGRRIRRQCQKRERVNSNRSPH